jgi:hypothetical protein
MEPERITVNCDTCDDSAFGTRENLELAGWRIEPEIELCPLDNFG